MQNTVVVIDDWKTDLPKCLFYWSHRVVLNFSANNVLYYESDFFGDFCFLTDANEKITMNVMRFYIRMDVNVRKNYGG